MLAMCKAIFLHLLDHSGFSEQGAILKSLTFGFTRKSCLFWCWLNEKEDSILDMTSGCFVLRIRHYCFIYVSFKNRSCAKNYFFYKYHIFCWETFPVTVYFLPEVNNRILQRRETGNIPHAICFKLSCNDFWITESFHIF